MPEDDCLIPGMDAVDLHRLLRRALGDAAAGSHEEGPRGPVLRRARRGPLPAPRNLFGRDEATAEAGPGPRPRPEAPLPRRADVEPRSARPHGRSSSSSGTSPRPRTSRSSSRPTSWPTSRRPARRRRHPEQGPGRRPGRACRPSERSTTACTRSAIKGESAGFPSRSLRPRGCRIEETEDGILKVYLPRRHRPVEIFRGGGRGDVQVRHFVRSRTSLEDLFARTVGVD